MERRGIESRSTFSINDAAFGDIVRSDFDGDFVARHDFNEILPHFAGDVRQDAVTIRKFDGELGVGQGLDDAALRAQRIFFGQCLNPWSRPSRSRRVHERQVDKHGKRKEGANPLEDGSPEFAEIATVPRCPLGNK